MKRRPFAPERMVGAIAWRVAFLAVQGGASVILFSALAHVLSRSAFEPVAVALGAIVIAQSIGDFGLSQAAVTILPARIAGAPESAPALLAGASLAYFWAAALALALGLGAVLIVPHAAALAVAVSAPAAAATVLVTGADGILRAQGEFRRPVLLVAASELGGFVAVPVASATGSATWTCVAMSAGTALGAAGSLSLLLRLRRAPGKPAARSFARASLPLGLAQIFIALGSRVDTLLAGALSGLLAAATFEGAWRTYQLGQYAVGAVASAAAPFVADALGAGRHAHAIRLVRRLLVGLLIGGAAVGAVLYLARTPLALLLTGSLSGSVARVLPIVAVISPVAAIGFVAFYTLISRDGERRYVLAVIAAGACVNLALAAALAGGKGARGAMIGSAAGLAVTNVLLLVRLWSVLRRLPGEDVVPPAAPEPSVVAQ